MPATAGRVRMPANNRVHSSSALQTHGIWQSTIGYDPYAPKPTLSNSNTKPDTDQNPYANYQGLLQLARLTAPSADVVRGACKRCGRVGHLTYQCRNFLSVQDNEKEDDPEATQADVASQLGKLKGKLGKAKEKDVVKTDSEDEEDDSESSDSDYDSDMERLIDQRCGKKSVRKDKLKKKKNRGSDVDGSETDSEERKKKRGRSKRRRSRKRKHDDSDDSEKDRKKRRKSKGRKRDESNDEDGKRRRRHRKSIK